MGEGAASASSLLLNLSHPTISSICYLFTIAHVSRHNGYVPVVNDCSYHRYLECLRSTGVRCSICHPSAAVGTDLALKASHRAGLRGATHCNSSAKIKPMPTLLPVRERLQYVISCGR
jgi:hypothetical protein